MIEHGVPHLKKVLDALADLAALKAGVFSTSPPKHEDCRCEIVVVEQFDHKNPFDVLGCKAAAKALLADNLGGVVVPSQEEWIGVNLLERDDEI